MTDANDPNLQSWVDIPSGSDFPIQNLPFGIFKTSKGHPKAGVAIGDQILDLAILFDEGFFSGIEFPLINVFDHKFLNSFLSLGKPIISDVRNRISTLLRSDNPELTDKETLLENLLVPQQQATMMVPVKVGDYTDFYSSIEHATNVGSMFRDPDNALLPNWRHLPVAYHGRASSIIVSGQQIHRPKGQSKASDGFPTFGPTQKLDFELEMAFITCENNPLGHSIPVSKVEDYIFGFVLFNDWSARDFQTWEYQPLGPFLAKNFASSISPWIVTLDALEPFRVEGPEQDPEVLPYLESYGSKNFDINLEVAIKSQESEEKVISRTNFKHMYWNVNQQLAHHTINGCNVKVGDMFASGTISGSKPGSYGSMLELAWNGTKPITLSEGTKRSFIEDQDIVVMRAYAEKNGVRIGFGEVSTRVLPSL